MPILLVLPDQMDAQDVKNLRDDIREIGGALDESNILIVVTQADKDPFTRLKKQSQGKKRLAVCDGAENRICYISAVMGFYAKRCSYPTMGSQSDEELYENERFLLATRSVEERIAVIDEKINKKKAEIETLEAQKQALLHPVTMKAVIAKAKEAGMSAKDIAEKLGLEI